MSGQVIAGNRTITVICCAPDGTQAVRTFESGQHKNVLKAAAEFMQRQADRSRPSGMKLDGGPSAVSSWYRFIVVESIPGDTNITQFNAS